MLSDKASSSSEIDELIALISRGTDEVLVESELRRVSNLVGPCV